MRLVALLSDPKAAAIVSAVRVNVLSLLSPAFIKVKPPLAKELTARTPIKEKDAKEARDKTFNFAFIVRVSFLAREGPLRKQSYRCSYSKGKESG